MSRFYDVLKHASPIQPAGDVFAVQEDVSTSGAVEQGDVHSVDSIHATKSHVSAATAVDPHADLWQISPQQEHLARRRITRNGLLGTTTDVIPERTAKPIPQSPNLDEILPEQLQIQPE